MEIPLGCPGMSRALASGGTTPNSLGAESSAKGLRAPDGCDGIFARVKFPSCRPPPPYSEIPQHLRGLTAKRRKRAGKAERQLDAKRGKRRAGRLSGDEDEGKFHQPRYDQTGCQRAHGDA